MPGHVPRHSGNVNHMYWIACYHSEKFTGIIVKIILNSVD